MFIKLKLFITGLAICMPILLPASAWAATNDQVFQACNTPAAKKSTFCQNQPKPGSKVENPVVNVINITASLIAIFAGIIAVVVLMIGGYNFITSGGVTPGQRGGDPNKIKTARSQITYALIGLVVIILAWAIIRFVTDKVVK